MALYQRGSVYWFDFWFKGVRYQDTTRSSNRRVAEQVVATLKAALAKGEVGIREKKEVPTFGEFWEDALTEIKSDNPDYSRTHDFYEVNFRKCLEFTPLAKAKLDLIDEELLARFRQHLLQKERLSAPTVNRRLGTVRRTLYLALKWRKISRVPSFPMMSEKGHTREFILTPALKGEFLRRSPEKYRTIFEFLLETGLRVSECVQLTRDRVFLDQSREFGRPFIHVRPDRQRQITIKSKRARHVPLFERALEIVVAQQGVSKSQFVFVQYGERVKKERQFLAPFSRHDVSRAFRKVAKEMNLSEAVLHSTRHTMLTELGAAGADASTIQLIAGHEDIRTSQKYLHPTPEHVTMAFERMHRMRAETAARMTAKGKETVGSAKVEWVQTVPTIFPTMEKAPARKCRKVVENKACESGGIGRRTRLRIWRVKPWGFESPLSHQGSGRVRKSGDFRSDQFCAHLAFGVRLIDYPHDHVSLSASRGI